MSNSILVRTRNYRARPATQRGNALLFALLGLVIMGLIAATSIEPTRAAQKASAGATEGTMLANLQGATNNMIFEFYPEIQAGNAITKNAVTLTPAMVGADLTWTPTVAQLVGMGYLPSGWTATTSQLNDAPYAVSFTRTPTGCAAAACNIEGHVVIMGPIRNDNAPGTTDGPSIGPILTRIGADSGVSLKPSPAVITGYGNTWTFANPVAGQPAGVVAVRVGTGASGFGQFVRIGDSRDPNLAGNLSAAGNLSIGGTSTLAGATTINGGLTMANSAITVKDGTGTSCVSILPNGTVNIKCSGSLIAKTGSFDDGAGNVTSVTPGSVNTTANVSAGGNVSAVGNVTAGGNISATGSVGGNRLVPTGNYVPGAACADNNAVAGSATTGGLVLCSGGAWRAIVTQSTAGQACAPEGSFAQADGVALLCRGGVYVPLSTFARTATSGQACVDIGATAVDTATNGTVLCRANPGGGSSLWYRIQDMTSNLQFVASVEAQDGTVVAKPTCGSTAGYAGQPAIVMTPKAEGSSDASFSRYAVDNGASWTVFLRDSQNNRLTANTGTGSAVAIAQQYCYYP